MAREISKTELRTNVMGKPVLDVIYTDGTKRKFDSEKLTIRRKRLRERRRAINKDIKVVDDMLTMVDEAVTKNAS